MLFGFDQRPRMYGGVPNPVFRSAACFVILLNPFLRNVWLHSPKKTWNSLLLLLVRSGREEMLSFFKVPLNILWMS
jgi:hypothetical protein